MKKILVLAVTSAFFVALPLNATTLTDDLQSAAQSAKTNAADSWSADKKRASVAWDKTKSAASSAKTKTKEGWAKTKQAAKDSYTATKKTAKSLISE